MQDTIADTIRVADEKFIESVTEDELDNFVFLERHPELPIHWLASSTDPTFTAKLVDVLGPRFSVAAFQLNSFKERCTEEGYDLVLHSSGLDIISWLKSLYEPPDVDINSDLEEATSHGLLPFQAVGFNMLKEKGGVAQWSTGTGKTVLASAITKYQREHGLYDNYIWVVKAMNKINAARDLKKVTGLDPIVIRGDRDRREKLYAKAADESFPLLIINYESFRTDFNLLLPFIANKKVSFIWDEMPNKLKNSTSIIYQNICEALYTSKNVNYYPSKGAERTEKVYHLMLSATPIENDPSDWFNCVRLIDPSVYGTTSEFNNTFISYRDKYFRPLGWRHLDWMGAKALHMTHQVDKDDPDIAKNFPRGVWIPNVVELSKEHARLYQMLADEYRYLKEGGDSLIKYTEIMSVIGVFQMICDNPRMVIESAKLFEQEKGGSEVAYKLRLMINNDAKFSDVNKKGEIICNKLLAWKEFMESRPNNKFLFFNRYARLGVPIMTEWLDQWGYDYETYIGDMTPNQRQAAQDRFNNDSSCQVMILSDAGSDSLNLQVANSVGNYNLPDTWAKLRQRIGRGPRLTSKSKTIEYTNFVVADTIEDRKQEILDRKYGFHKAVLKGQIAEQSQFLRGTDELIYLLTGESSLNADS